MYSLFPLSRFSFFRSIRLSLAISLLPLFSLAQEAKTISVLVFLSPDCPISISQSLELKALEEEFQKEVFFEYYFPLSEKLQGENRAFLEKMGLNAKAIGLNGWEKAQELKATTMPEVFVFKDQRLAYRGRIDNSFVALGKRRRAGIERELYLVLAELHSAPFRNFDFTDPIGCLIPSKKPQS